MVPGCRRVLSTSFLQIAPPTEDRGHYQGSLDYVEDRIQDEFPFGAIGCHGMDDDLTHDPPRDQDQQRHIGPSFQDVDLRAMTTIRPLELGSLRLRSRLKVRPIHLHRPVSTIPEPESARAWHWVVVPSRGWVR